MDIKPTDPNLKPDQSPETPKSPLEKSEKIVTEHAVPIPDTGPVSAAFTPATAAPSKPAPAAAVVHSTPGMIVLQWLTYAFWGWTVLGMSILTTTVIATFVSGVDTGDFTPYGIAALLVLLPISVLCDVFYAKQEPDKKVGGASIVMVIHAVIFGLFGIGALIAAVIALVTLFTSSSGSDASQIALYSALIITVLYAAVFLRTIHPPKFPWIRRFYTIFMVVSVGLVSILGIVGPVAHARETRSDKLIESNLSNIENAVSDYTTKNNRMPVDLASLEFTGDTKKLIDDKLVSYKPDTKPATPITDGYNYTTPAAKSSMSYYYQLCVTYKKSGDNGFNSYDDGYKPASTNSEEYNITSDTYRHPAGDVCYKVKVDDNNY